MRKDRAVEAIARAASEFAARESNHRSMITVTRAELDARGTSVTIYLSAFPEDKLVGATHFLNRRQDEFRAFLKSKVKLRAIPRIRFLPEPNRGMIETGAEA